MRRTVLPALLLLLAMLCACAAPAAAPAPDPTIAPTPSLTAPPTPAPTPTPEPTPEPPMAMAADGEHPLLIAHGGGAIYGYRLTNSLEALEASYEAGFRWFELDFERSSDGEPVLIHDWESMAARLLGEEGRRSLRRFKAADALAGLTLLDLGDLLTWLEAHPDAQIITDVKSEDNQAVLAEIRERAGEARSRFIPQAYSFEEAEALLAEGWERVILTLYRMDVTPGELADFCAGHALWAVTMSDARISGELAAAVAESGTALYCHAVNSLDFVDAWREAGLTGIYTDYFQPKHWPSPEPG